MPQPKLSSLAKLRPLTSADDDASLGQCCFHCGQPFTGGLSLAVIHGHPKAPALRVHAECLGRFVVIVTMALADANASMAQMLDDANRETGSPAKPKTRRLATKDGS